MRSADKDAIDSSLPDFLNFLKKKGMTYKEGRLYEKIMEDIEKTNKYHKMGNYYMQFQSYYKNTIEKMLQTFNTELVIYDETEYFR